jgi:hypothetical protein
VLRTCENGLVFKNQRNRHEQAIPFLQRSHKQCPGSPAVASYSGDKHICVKHR